FILVHQKLISANVVPSEFMQRSPRRPAYAGPLSFPQMHHIAPPTDYNPVNHPFGRQWNDGKESYRAPLCLPLGLDQPPAYRVANQACRFVYVQLSHEPCSVRLGSLYADPQLNGNIPGGLSFGD